MKQTFKRAMMPLAVVVLGAAAAFATNAAKQNNSAQSMVKGYYYDISKPPAERCVDVNQWCSNIPTPNTCEDSFGRDLHELNVISGTCTTALYRL